MAKKLLLPMAFFLSFWLTMGRGLLGSAGWLTIIYGLLLVPFIFLSFSALFFISRKLTLSAQDNRLLLCMYASWFLHGFFVVDGTDNKEDTGSVACNLFGQSFQQTSSSLSILMFFVAIILLAVLFTRFIRLRASEKSTSSSATINKP